MVTNVSVVYPELVGEIAKRGIKRGAIAAGIGISKRALYNKLSGTVSFTWDEVCAITERFFPDIDVKKLFARVDDSSQDSE